MGGSAGMTILIGRVPPLPPDDLLNKAIASGNLEDLEQWFINQNAVGYSFQAIAEFVEHERSERAAKSST